MTERIRSLGRNDLTTLVLLGAGVVAGAWDRADAGMISFQEDAGGYTATRDTHVWSTRPDESGEGQGSGVNINGAAGTILPGTSHGLLRFDDIFGPGAIPSGATIVSAELLLWTTTTNLHGTMHRMLLDWSEDTTWNDVGGNGIQADDVEAASAVSATPLTASGFPSSFTLDVTADVQAWANGQSNYGWVFLPDPNEAVYWSFYSSDDVSSFNDHPTLTVQFESATAAPEPSSLLMLGMAGLLVAGITLRRRRAATLADPISA